MRGWSPTAGTGIFSGFAETGNSAGKRNVRRKREFPLETGISDETEIFAGNRDLRQKPESPPEFRILPENGPSAGKRILRRKRNIRPKPEYSLLYFNRRLMHARASTRTHNTHARARTHTQMHARAFLLPRPSPLCPSFSPSHLPSSPPPPSSLASLPLPPCLPIPPC